jgi:hypothetical protein
MERKWTIADLTEQAAEEDAKELCEHISSWLWGIVYYFSQDESATKQGVDHLERTKQETNKILSDLSIIKTATEYVAMVYKYMNSDYPIPPNDGSDWANAGFAQIALDDLLFRRLINNMVLTDSNKDYDMLRNRMPRFAFAMKLADTRFRFDAMLLYPNEGVEYRYLHVQELADLAGVTYMAIKKQLNVKIRAQKRGDVWVIPAESALDYLTKRKSKS